MRSLLQPWFPWFIGALAALLLHGCTLPQQLLFALIPDGTIPTFLANFKTLPMPMQQQLGELHAKEDWPAIVTLADQSLAKDPFSAEWWLVRGYALGRQTRWSEAADALSRSVAIDPQALEGWHMLAQAQRSDGAWMKSLHTLERSLEVARDAPLTFYLIGEIRREQRQFGAARSAYREAIRLAPHAAQAWYGLGLVEHAEGRMNERDAVAQRLREMSPGLAERLAALPATGEPIR